MAGFTFIEDSYAIRARLAPSVLVFVPLLFASASWWPGEVKWPGILAGTGISLALGMLLAQLGRDLGKAKQRRLFEKWGGTPSTQLLSHRASTLNPHTLKRVHTALQELRPELRLPRSLEEELADPKAADALYDSCAHLLREASRDKTKFPLVFEENVSFGFRRNLWAMKPTGIFIAVVSAALCFAKAWVQLVRTNSVDAVASAFMVVCIMLLVLWCVRITPHWVRTAAFSYAERLLGICDTFPVSKPEAKIIQSGS